MLADNASKVIFHFRLATYFSQASKWLLPLKVINAVLFRHYRYVTGIQIVSGTKIGGGLKIVHLGSIVINGGAVIGENCTIYHDVTIGASLYNDDPVPRIGNYVVLCAGAKVLGDVSIGDKTIVAANAVVTKDIPSGVIAGGIPARVISTNAEDKALLWQNVGIKVRNRQSQ